MDYLSSMYIDNEMDLDQKKQFVERIRSDHLFYGETLEFLAQEKKLRKLPVMPKTLMEKKWRPHAWTILARWFKPLGFATAGFATAVLIVLTLFPPPMPTMCNNRFVLFEPAANQVELAGSFTEWQRVPMRRAGDSGYWEVNIQVPPGEHRFAYILDGNRQMADPTLSASEKDDFGGQNSILSVEARI
jgi:hypothetical protein